MLPTPSNTQIKWSVTRSLMLQLDPKGNLNNEGKRIQFTIIPMPVIVSFCCFSKYFADIQEHSTFLVLSRGFFHRQSIHCIFILQGDKKLFTKVWASSSETLIEFFLLKMFTAPHPHYLDQIFFLSAQRRQPGPHAHIPCQSWHFPADEVRQKTISPIAPPSHLTLSASSSLPFQGTDKVSVGSVRLFHFLDRLKNEKLRVVFIRALVQCTLNFCLRPCFVDRVVWLRTDEPSHGYVIPASSKRFYLVTDFFAPLWLLRIQDFANTLRWLK